MSLFQMACDAKSTDLIKLMLLHCKPAERLKLISSLKNTPDVLIAELTNYAEALQKLDKLLSLQFKISWKKSGSVQLLNTEKTVLELLKQLNHYRLFYANKNNQLVIITSDEINKIYDEHQKIFESAELIRLHCNKPVTEAVIAFAKAQLEGLLPTILFLVQSKSRLKYYNLPQNVLRILPGILSKLTVIEDDGEVCLGFKEQLTDCEQRNLTLIMNAINDICYHNITVKIFNARTKPGMFEIHDPFFSFETDCIKGTFKAYFKPQDGKNFDFAWSKLCATYPTASSTLNIRVGTSELWTDSDLLRPAIP